jgi:hypothetical protein
MQHQTINIDQPAATRAFDLGDGFGQLWMITFFDERDSCHEFAPDSLIYFKKLFAPPVAPKGENSKLAPSYHAQRKIAVPDKHAVASGLFAKTLD